jgi:nucleoside-triphosphatase THEP1
MLLSNDRPPIAALQGASSARIQRLMAEYAAKLARGGWRVAGVVEIGEAAPGGACGNLSLRDLQTGEMFAISQNLGPGSQACNLDGRGVTAACAAVERALAGGLDFLILSKFGKLEAARGGLHDAFQRAVVSGTPLLTAVSPAMATPWAAFAGPLSEYLPAEAAAIEAWGGRCFSKPSIAAE